MDIIPQTHRRFSRASERAAKHYSSDLSDPEWEIICPLLPLPSQVQGGELYMQVLKPLSINVFKNQFYSQ